jgi:hypothetical protein
VLYNLITINKYGGNEIMGQSIANWESHFKDLTHEQRALLYKSLNLLEQDSMIKKEYDWTGLFVLKSCIENSDEIIRKEIRGY